MVPPVDQEAVEGALDQEAVKGTMDGTNDGSGSSRRSDGWYHRWIRKQSKERLIRKQSKERWVVPTIDYEAVEGAMDGTIDG